MSGERMQINPIDLEGWSTKLNRKEIVALCEKAADGKPFEVSYEIPMDQPWPENVLRISASAVPGYRPEMSNEEFRHLCDAYVGDSDWVLRDPDHYDETFFNELTVKSGEEDDEYDEEEEDDTEDDGGEDVPRAPMPMLEEFVPAKSPFETVPGETEAAIPPKGNIQEILGKVRTAKKESKSKVAFGSNTPPKQSERPAKLLQQKQPSPLQHLTKAVAKRLVKKPEIQSIVVSNAVNTIEPLSAIWGGKDAKKVVTVDLVSLDVILSFTLKGIPHFSLGELNLLSQKWSCGKKPLWSEWVMYVSKDQTAAVEVRVLFWLVIECAVPWVEAANLSGYFIKSKGAQDVIWVVKSNLSLAKRGDDWCLDLNCCACLGVWCCGNLSNFAKNTGVPKFIETVAKSHGLSSAEFCRYIISNESMADGWNRSVTSFRLSGGALLDKARASFAGHNWMKFFDKNLWSKRDDATDDEKNAAIPISEIVGGRYYIFHPVFSSCNPFRNMFTSKRSAKLSWCMFKLCSGREPTDELLKKYMGFMSIQVRTTVAQESVSEAEYEKIISSMKEINSAEILSTETETVKERYKVTTLSDPEIGDEMRTWMGKLHAPM